MTLACEDVNSKLIDVVTVADVDAEKHVGFGSKVNFFQTLSTRFVQDFEVELQARYGS